MRCLLSTVFLLLTFSLFAFLALTQVRDYDIFWQLHSGRYMWESGTIIRQDLFSLAFDVARWEHCWLHDLIVYAVYNFGGYVGLSVWKCLLIASTTVVLVLAARTRGGSWPAILLLTLPAMLLTNWAWVERPQLWTFLCFAVALLLLERFERDRQCRDLWLLLPLMVFWVNLHAAAVLGLLLTGAYLAAHLLAGLAQRQGWLESPRPVAGKLTLAWLGMLAMMLVNPYGATPLTMLWTAPQLGESSGELAQAANLDWMATTFAGFPEYYIGVGVAFLLLLLNWRRLRLTDLILLAGLAVMGFKLMRHTPFFLMAGAVLLPLYADRLGERLMGNAPRWRSALPALAATIGLVAIVTLAWQCVGRWGVFTPGLNSWNYPVAAAEFVHTQRLPGNLYNSYNQGGYLMWRLFPAYRVFFDSRQDSAEMFRQGMQVSYALGNWTEVLDKHQVNTIVMRTCTVFPGNRYPLVDALYRSPAWELVFADTASLVLVRAAAVDPVWLASHRQAKDRMYDTVLSEASLLVAENPDRHDAWWEIAQVQGLKQNYPAARQALGEYLKRTGRPRKDAAEYLRALDARLGGRS